MSHPLPDLESFATSRGFTEHELKEYGIRIEDGEVVIPILGRGGGVWYERRHRPGGHPKYISPDGALPHLYNPLGLGPHSDDVWFAEGEFDTLSLVVSGIPAVGILGTQTFIKDWIHLFAQADVVLALDPDQAGETACAQLAGWIDQKGGNWSRFLLPEDHADLNEWFVANRQQFEEAVNEW